MSAKRPTSSVRTEAGFGGYTQLGFDSAPVWSPGGRKILCGQRHHPDVWIMNADGSSKQKLTQLKGQD